VTKKSQKNFGTLGLWAMGAGAQAPMARHRKSFLLLFFKKEALPPSPD
jgi:hypothetical protein